MSADAATPARPAGGEPRELEAMKRRYLAACRMVTALNYGKRDWTLCVPARPEHDPDLVIQAALDDLEILLTRAAASPAGGPPGEREREDGDGPTCPHAGCTIPGRHVHPSGVAER